VKNKERREKEDNGPDPALGIVPGAEWARIMGGKGRTGIHGGVSRGRWALKLSLSLGIDLYRRLTLNGTDVFAYAAPVA
jgi:hypothetical protein